MNAPDQWQVTPQAAELYERYPGRYILGPWAPLLVDAARLKVGERVLDVACGTGLVTHIAAQHVGPRRTGCRHRPQSWNDCGGAVAPSADGRACRVVRA